LRDANEPDGVGSGIGRTAASHGRAVAGGFAYSAVATRVRAENLSTSGDLDVFVDQPTETIDP
jgi:hypothetical protein